MKKLVMEKTDYGVNRIFQTKLNPNCAICKKEQNDKDYVWVCELNKRVICDDCHQTLKFRDTRETDKIQFCTSSYPKGMEIHEHWGCVLEITND